MFYFVSNAKINVFWFKEDSVSNKVAWTSYLQRHRSYGDTGPSLRENCAISLKARQKPKNIPPKKCSQEDWEGQEAEPLILADAKDTLELVLKKILRRAGKVSVFAHCSNR